MNGSPFPYPDPARPAQSGGETHRLVASGSGVAVAVQFEQRRGVAGFQTVVFGLESTASPLPSSGPRPIVISALDITFGQGWELRTSGLWAEQVRERPFDHWSYGLEAFALAIDEPDELIRSGLGHRVALGWELDFIANGPPEVAAGSQSGSFTQTGTIEGLLLTGDGEQPFEGPARRSHWPGDRPAHTDVDKLDHRERSEPGSIVLPTMHGPWTVSHTASAA
ncbi:MAG: hypothetical protein OEZ14_04665 [Acidimicrobiia bacterium]|nr:hypothetical protein [Acidimicrobiia bacterium]MDH5519809.1 hypothetical protein [Acidimicrobiia bacterium]